MSDNPKITVIGTGQMGSLYTRLLSQMGYLDSVVDTNHLLAQKIGEKYDIPYYSSIAEFKQHQKPNGAIITVPTKDHCKIAKEIINQLPSLKAMIIEKPISFSLKEAQDFKQFLDQKDTAVIIGHTEVYNPVVPKILDFLNNKSIGEIRSVVFQRRGSLTEKKLSSLGDVYTDIGVHDFSIISKIFKGREVNIFAASTEIDNIDNSSTIIMFPDDNSFYITLILSREFAGKIRKVNFEGTKATLSANFLEQILEIRSLEIAKGNRETSSIYIPFSSGEKIQSFGEPLLTELWNLIDCIQGQSTPIVSLDEAIHSLEIVKMVKKSIEGRIVTKIVL